MKKTYIFIFIFLLLVGFLLAVYPDGKELLKKIDQNILTKTLKAQTTMTIYGKRATRTLTSINWSQGTDKAFSEYLSPAREKGTKMLMDGDNLWIFDPKTDRIVQISGNMLKQSVMGSDLSYEDYLEEVKLEQDYTATVIGEITYKDRDCWKLKLTAQKPEVSYPSRIVYVDKQRFLPLYEERYAKSGKLLKTTSILEVMQVAGRWYPKQILYKDELLNGKGTLFTIDTIEIDIPIPAHIFTKAALKK